MKAQLIVLALLVSVCGVSAKKVNAANDRCIVGILTQPTDGGLTALGSAYVAASYVKFIEAGGCRTVPVFHNSSVDDLEKVFNSINGIFFPGGGSDISLGTELRRAGEFFVNRAIAASDKGDYFPIFGHCMGFEMISLIISGDENLLSACDAENLPLSLNVTTDAFKSRWWSGLTADTKSILTTQDVTMNNHNWGVYPSSFASNSKLNTFFRVLSTNMDRKGREFISTWEGVKYPVYAAQWHAEKNQYEWNPDELIPHSIDAITSMVGFSTFIGSEARKSQHTYPTPADADKAVFYNYRAYYTEAITGDFEQCYVW